MSIRVATLGLGLLPFLSAPCLAGPCTPQIQTMQLRLQGALDARAAAGPAGVESSAATMGHQPTPASIAAAEVALGDVSDQTVQAVEAAMARARKADLAGNKRGCRRALAEAQRAAKLGGVK